MGREKIHYMRIKIDTTLETDFFPYALHEAFESISFVKKLDMFSNINHLIFYN